ncbi:TPA: fimbria/pilus periplasmic chaperone [Klebsiella quasipneumoniae subsp. similipneumoniae]|nr:fimbria/pilus periplasmic chaperone [Klebsiella quasipneumoniae subsp. similipneumoniae]
MQKLYIPKKFLYTVSLLVALTTNVMASVVVSGTRVIYQEEESEVTVKVTNKGTKPVLIQAWLDNGDQNASPALIKTPFVITPPISRINGLKGQTLRISKISTSSLPKDRESIYWLNVLEIPSMDADTASENKLQVAFRTRIKFFYRPEGLRKDISKIMSEVEWAVEGNRLVAKNNTPFYVNLLGAEGTAGKAKTQLNMLSPFEKMVFESSKGVFKPGDIIHIRYLNDFGAMNSKEVKL